MPSSRGRTPLLVAAAALVVLGAPSLAVAQPSPSSAAERDARDLVVLSGDISVRRGEVAGEVVVIHGSVVVAGVVNGDVVLLDGPVVVTGQVSGAVVAVGGRVELGPNANVRGDVIARRGISLARGAVVGGSVRPGTAFTFRTAIDAFGPFATWLAVMVSTLALGALLLVLAPRASERVAATVTASPWRSSLLGFGLAIAVPLAALLLVVSLVAWPLGLAALLAVWFVAWLGFAWSVFALGRRVWHAPRSRWLAFAFGWLILAAVTAIPIAGGIVWTLAAIVGVGAASLALWRSRVGGEGPTPSTGGRHRAGGRMPEPVPLVRESVMEQEGTGI